MTAIAPGRTARKVILHEVGPRDGLQMEKQVVPLEQKDALDPTALLAAGVDIIQLGSFVHPEKVPQMADTDALFRRLTAGQDRRPRVLSGLVLNEKGLERGLACGVEMFCMGVSASETHSQKNTGMSTAEATRRIIADGASRRVAAGKKVQVSVQSAFGCGFEGPVPDGARAGHRAQPTWRPGSAASAWPTPPATPTRRRSSGCSARSSRSTPAIECTCHFHNTYGLGMANCYAALRRGRDVASRPSFAGLGGCPFTKVPAGNVGHRGPRPLAAARRACARTSTSTTLVERGPRRGGVSSAASCRAASYKTGLASSDLKAGDSMTNTATFSKASGSST